MPEQPNDPALLDVIDARVLHLINSRRGPIPCLILDFDEGPPAVVKVQIAVNFAHRGEDGLPEFYQVDPIANVPVEFPGSGAYSITWPIASGDEARLIPMERSIEEWKKEGGTGHSPRDWRRRYSLSDVVCIPGSRSTPGAIPANAFESNAMVIEFPTLLLLGKGAARHLAVAEDILTRMNTIESAHNTHNHPTAPTGPVSPPSVVIVPTTVLDDLKTDEIKLR